MKKKRTGHTCFVGAKLDMAKMYGLLEWSFIDTMMNAMGFLRKISNTVMDCSSSITFSFLVNGKRTE